MLQSVIRVGNSLAVVIPRPLRQKIGLKPGDRVSVDGGMYHDEVIIRKNDHRKVNRSSITPEFISWLEGFNKRYSSALKELAKR